VLAADSPSPKTIRGLWPLEKLRISRELRSRHRIPPVRQAVDPQPGRPGFTGAAVRNARLEDRPRSGSPAAAPRRLRPAPTPIAAHARRGGADPLAPGWRAAGCRRWPGARVGEWHRLFRHTDPAGEGAGQPGAVGSRCLDQHHSRGGVDHRHPRRAGNPLQVGRGGRSQPGEAEDIALHDVRRCPADPGGLSQRPAPPAIAAVCPRRSVRQTWGPVAGDRG